MAEDKDKEPTKRQQIAAVGCVSVIALVVIVIVIAVVSGGEDEGATITLSAQASTDGAGNVYVTNDDTFVWYDIELKVNGEFAYSLDELSARERMQIASREFVKNDGTRFNWLATKVLELAITACVPKADVESTICGDGYAWGYTRLVWE